MTAAQAGIASALPDIAPEQAGFAHAVARVLRDHGLEVAIRSVQGSEGGWYLGPNFAFRPARANAAPVGADGQRLQQALEAHRELLDMVEAATGLAVEFNDYGALEQDCAAVVLSRSDELAGELVALVSCPRAPLARAKSPLSLECIAAQLSMEDAANTGPGDIVILSAGAWALRQSSGDAGAARLGFDPLSGRVAPFPQPNSTAAGEHSMAERQGNESFTVPVGISLPDTVVSAADLDTLAQGGTIELGAVSEGLNVTLSVGGRTLGRGELIRLGDRFAVLIEDPAETGSTQAPTDDPHIEDDV